MKKKKNFLKKINFLTMAVKHKKKMINVPRALKYEPALKKKLRQTIIFCEKNNKILLLLKKKSLLNFILKKNAKIGIN